MKTSANADGVSSKNVITKEFAESEFDRFCELMALTFDYNSMDDEDKRGFRQSKEVFVHAVMVGSLTVNDKGEPIFTPTVGDDRSPITFHEPTGATLKAMDIKKAGHSTAKGFAAMADHTGVAEVTFSKMANRDIKVCQAISLLFLA